MFRVLIEGHNLLLPIDDGIRRSGFLQTYWIDAENAMAAVSKAVEAAAADQELREHVVNEEHSPAWISVFEVAHCTAEEVEELEANPTGKAFFPETLWSRFLGLLQRLRGNAYSIQ